jgi:hypothetical protein
MRLLDLCLAKRKMYEQYVTYFETITHIIFLTNMEVDGFLKMINGYTEQ